MTAYAELQVCSNFTFLEGASHAEELARTAAALGHTAIAITDRNTLAGVVRGHLAAKAAGIRFVVGCRLDLQDGASLLAYPTDRAAYGRLSRLLTVGKRRAPKGACYLGIEDVADHAEGLILVALPPDDAEADGFPECLELYRTRFGSFVHVAAVHQYRGDDVDRLTRLAHLAARTGVPMVASNDVLYHEPARRALHDILTCIRHHCTIETAGFRLQGNAERHLKPAHEMARLFARWPDAVARTLEIADACRFSLDELRYEYPDEVMEGAGTAQEHLIRLTWEGAAGRYPDGVSDKVRGALVHELALIEQLGYAPYFLTVYDVVRFARSRGILCQGRGSAANSAVCFCLGITAVDPARIDLLFERFVSAARNEPPDIDVDFEHERREEVIQYIYEKYGRDRAGLAATVIRYRARSAVREVGKAMGLSMDMVGRLAASIWGWGMEGITDAQASQQGLDSEDPKLALTLRYASELIGFPRHLSQHVGGFVMTRGLLSELCPILNAAMPDRTTIEWDKDDIDALGILKVDVLALGMLTCARKGLALISAHHNRNYDLATIPAEDPDVYEMLSRADSLGVFQVESRAQMTMLPRLKPRCFYDLVIEVAIVRPGPIQGDMVHPYLRRRSGTEKVEYPSEDLRRVLEKTLGVPLFQEQAMKIAIVAAGFTPSEADQLRRAMATFRHVGTISQFRTKMIDGMVSRGYEAAFAERCFKQIEGFGTYGFPESHAASFALLVYASSWIKHHHPEAFACALLNSQPMGFYAPAQIVRDAEEHGVTVLPPDVNASQWDCTLEDRGPGDAGPLTGGEGGQRPPPFGLRLGFRLIKGLPLIDAERLVGFRTHPYRDIDDLWRRTGIAPAVLELLAGADAFRSMGLDRRKATWSIRALDRAPLPLFAHLEGPMVHEAAVALPELPLGEAVVADYASLALTLRCHPLRLLRSQLAGLRIVPAERLRVVPDGQDLAVAGLVLVRQRPGTAKGVIFITLEDETGVANLVVFPTIFERFRREILASRLLAAAGRVEKTDGVIHLKVERLMDLTHRLASLAVDAGPESLDGGLARADEVRSPQGERQSRASAFPDGRNFR